MKRLRAFAATSPARFAAAVATATNEITRRSPAPKDLPYFGLDHPIGVGAKLLDRLSELGIFRYYERVLDLDASLGGPARWLARRRGCEVVSLDRSAAEAATNVLLVRRAHLVGEVTVLSGSFEQVPAKDASFTHAWSVEGLGRGGDVDRIFAELFRVVRPGGHVALQDWMRPSEWGVPDASAPPSSERLLERLRAAGFERVHALAATELREPESTLAGIARERALEALGHPWPNERSAVAAAFLELEDREQAVARGELALVQMFAQRPS